jgi:uncharacterized protein
VCLLPEEGREEMEAWPFHGIRLLSPMPSLEALESVLSDYRSVLVGYSGGVDSALVAVVGRRVLGPERSLAAIGISESLARDQLEQARDIARLFDLRVVEVSTEELSDPNYSANPKNRCYFCKRELWSKLNGLAAEHHLSVVADGTNRDDLGEHRPGSDAAAESGIRSPLAEVGYTKDDVRAVARELGIPVWDAPAAPCLSSRVLYGLEVTPLRLRQVEEGEAFLRGLGVAGDLRVRHRGAEARIEASPAQFELIRQGREAILQRFLGLGFSKVTLDLAGYRRGNLLDDAVVEIESLAGQA